MTQGWWAVVRYGATALAAGLTAASQYYPDVHWISIVVLTLAILGFHVVPTTPPMYKMTVTPQLTPPVTSYTVSAVVGGGSTGGQGGATGGNGK